MNVRPITYDEIDSVLDLYWQGLEYEFKILRRSFPHKDINPKGKPAIKEILQDYIVNKNTHILAAFEQGECIGYTVGTLKFYPAENPGQVGFVSGLFVKESYRRLGIATSLFESLSSWFKSQNAQIIELSYMMSDDKAQGFWQKMGFKGIQIQAMKSL